MIVFHIVTPDIWGKFKDEYEYAAESLTSEGFIHCSYRNQLDDVLAAFCLGRF